MKIKNYTIFDRRATKNWNKLRDSKEEKDYFIPSDKKNYLMKLNSYDPDKKVINDFSDLVQRSQIKKIISFCSGTCKIEYYLMKKFNLICEVSDNTHSIERIKKFKIFHKVSFIDMTNEFKIDIDNNTIVLLSRIDTEFEDYQLQNFFRKMYNLKVRYIYFIPAEIITLKTILVKIKILIICFLRFREPVSWGYIRSFYGFNKLWRQYYETISKSTKGLILKIK